MTLLAVAASGAFGQSATRPKFEVAAVKPSQEMRFTRIRPLPGGRLTATAPLRLLMQNAYGLFPFQIVGGPDWIKSDRYEIDAKAEGNPSKDQLLVMLQTLLEDRFQLKTHRETKEMAVYTLVPAKGGPKLPAAKEGSCVTPVPGGPPLPPGLVPECGRIRIMMEASGARLQGGQVPLTELVGILATVMGRPVIDKTGFTGTFDLQMDFIPDLATAGLPMRPGSSDGAPSAPNPETPTIFLAIQEKLGLKLESTRAPVETMVIDHVERPSGN